MSTMILYRVSQLTESRNGLADVRFASRYCDKIEKKSIERSCIIYSGKPEEKTLKTIRR
jgi:hypothetical protein